MMLCIYRRSKVVMIVTAQTESQYKPRDIVSSVTATPLALLSPLLTGLGLAYNDNQISISSLCRLTREHTLAAVVSAPLVTSLLTPISSLSSTGGARLSGMASSRLTVGSISRVSGVLSVSIGLHSVHALSTTSIQPNAFSSSLPPGTHHRRRVIPHHPHPRLLHAHCRTRTRRSNRPSSSPTLLVLAPGTLDGSTMNWVVLQVDNGLSGVFVGVELDEGEAAVGLHADFDDVSVSLRDHNSSLSI